MQQTQIDSFFDIVIKEIASLAVHYYEDDNEDRVRVHMCLTGPFSQELLLNKQLCKEVSNVDFFQRIYNTFNGNNVKCKLSGDRIVFDFLDENTKRILFEIRKDFLKEVDYENHSKEEWINIFFYGKIPSLL